LKSQHALVHRSHICRFGFKKRIAALFLLIWNAFFATGLTAEPGPIMSWQFDAQRVTKGSLTATTGNLNLAIIDNVQFSQQAPASAILNSGNSTKQYFLAALDIAKIKLPNQNMTVSAWVQVNKLQDWGGIAGALQDNGDFERGWLLGFRQDRFCFAVASENKKRLTYLTATSRFEPEYWYHVVGTYDGRTMRLYVDGEIQAESKEQSGKIAYPDHAAFALGAYKDDNEFYPLHGQLESVNIWDRTLSAENVRQGFQSRKASFPEIDEVHPIVVGWPTFNRDNQRTGLSIEQLPPPLKLDWTYKTRLPPSPAWPAPAKQDFWHKKTNLNPRVIYDRAFHVVSIGNRVYFSSSSNDKVTCLDSETGREVWTFFCGGPVRLAPTLAEGKAVFGSDDGYVYCLNATTGKLIWKFFAAETDHRIVGNGRLISHKPIRTGVLIEEGTAFFCAGLFPNQGVEQFAVDFQTGKKISSGPLTVSAQGYLERRSGRLYMPTGRDPAGAFASRLKRRGKGVSREIRKIPAEFGISFIGAAGIRIGGGDGKVAMFRHADGKKLWSSEVDGKVYSLAIANGKLFASTDSGTIYCFSEGKQVTKPLVIPERHQAVSERNRTGFKTTGIAQSLVDQSGVRKGYCLVLGIGDGSFLVDLARKTEWSIVGVETDAERIDEVRPIIDSAGLYGNRITIQQIDKLQSLPFSDYLFNVVVTDSVFGTKTFAKSRWKNLRSEIERITRPISGVAFFDLSKEKPFRRKPIVGAGEWSHMYADAANTVCSHDQHVGGAMKLQWFGGPGPRNMIDRHHRTIAPLFKNGRLFIPGDDRIVVLDAYNGTPLWDVVVPNSKRIAAFRDSSSIVATDDLLYIASADRCLALDAETGVEKFAFDVPAHPDGKKEEWGYIASVGDHLFGSAVKPGSSRRQQSYKVAATETYWDFVPLVGSDAVFCMDRNEGSHRWIYRSNKGLIVNSTLTIGNGAMFFIESQNPATLSKTDGKATAKELLGSGAALVAVNANSGKELWRKAIDLSAVQHNVYLSYAQGKLVTVGSRNEGTDKKTAKVLYDIQVFDAKTGLSIWEKTQDQGTKIGGDHGEQDHRPVVVGNRLYCEPFAYDLATGKPLKDWAWINKHRRGCGNISASASSFFFRQSNPTMFDLKTNTYSKVTAITRPGCWINIIPAGGLLLIPEASSGCTCNYAMQTSLAFLPVQTSPAKSSKSSSESLK